MSDTKPTTPIFEKQLAVHIGRVCRTAREALSLTREDVANAAGVSVAFYGRVERGNALPSLTTLVTLAEALRINVDDLVGIHADALQFAKEPDPPELHRLIRRIVKFPPQTQRLVILMLSEMERSQPTGD